MVITNLILLQSIPNIRSTSITIIDYENIRITTTTVLPIQLLIPKIYLRKVIQSRYYQYQILVVIPLQLLITKYSY